MSRLVPILVLAGILATWAPLSADAPEPKALPLITRYDGSEWVSLGRHSIRVTGAGATKEGTATATLKSKLDGPKTYVVIDASTSELVMNDPKPRFRVASDKATAVSVQLAQFETDDTVRSTTIERTRRGVFFTKGIDLEVNQIAEGLWELRPTKSLQPGEYALVTTDTDPVADFTIEARGY
jgi:hypothetical protein